MANIPVGWNLQHGQTERAEIGTEVSIRHGWNNVRDVSGNDKDAEKDEGMKERGLSKSDSTKRNGMRASDQKLSENWGLIRECITFIKDNSDGWKKRSSEETKRIHDEEKTGKLEMVVEKKNMSGKKSQKKLKRIETAELKRVTSMRLEVAKI